jgi:hypothetical protein
MRAHNARSPERPDGNACRCVPVSIFAYTAVAAVLSTAGESSATSCRQLPEIPKTT